MLDFVLGLNLNLREPLREELVDWPLVGEPWVVFRTLTDLLEKKEKDNLVIKMRKAICKHPLIRNIFEELNEDSYWGRPKDIHTW